MFAGLKRRFHPLFILWAAFMWVLLQGELSIGNVVAGLLVGLGVVLLLPLPAVPIGGITLNFGPLIALVSIWIIDLFKGAFHVAWLAFRPQDPPNTAILVVPMRVESEAIFALATVMYNLQPGGTVTDLDIAKREWIIHLLDASSDRSINRQREQVAELERRLIATFERGKA